MTTPIKLNKYIESSKASCLNEKKEGSGREALVSSSLVTSDCDAQLIFIIPFKTQVKLTELNIGIPPLRMLYFQHLSLLFALHDLQ